MTKISQKDLKKEMRAGQEVVWQASNSALSWMKSQWLVFAIILLIGAALLVGGALYVYQTREREADAQHVLGKALAEFQQWKLADSKARPESLKKLEAEMSLLSTNHADTKAAQYAALIQAQVFSEEKKWAEASTEFEKFERVLPRRRKSLAWYPMAVSFEEQGLSEKALEYYGRIVEAKDPSYHKWALLGQGRLYRAAKKFEEAKKSYQQFIEEYPKSPELQTVRGLLTQVSSNQP